MRRTPGAWAVTAVLVLLTLSGCGRITADIAVHEDGTYDLSLVMAGSETELATVGQTPESFTDLLTERLAAQPGVEDVVVSDYREDGYAGVEITGENLAGDDVGVFGRSVVTADADGVHLNLQYPVTILTGSLPPEQAAAVEIRTTATFPSAVTDHNGTLVDRVTVEWTGDGSTDLDYTASAARTAEATGDGGAARTGATSAWALPLGLALGVMVLAGLGTWLVLRDRTGR